MQKFLVSKYRDVASLTVLRRSSSILALCSYCRARIDPLNMDPADSTSLEEFQKYPVDKEVAYFLRRQDFLVLVK